MTKAIDPEIVTIEISSLARAAGGDPPVSPWHQGEGPRRPPDPDSMKVLADALEESGCDWQELLVWLRADHKVSMAMREFLWDLGRFHSDRHRRSKVIAAWHRELAAQRQRREREELAAASRGEQACVRAVKRECVLVEDSGRGDAAYRAKKHLAECTGLYCLGDKFFRIEDGEAECLGDLVDLFDAYRVPYHQIEDLFGEGTGVYCERRNGVVRVTDQCYAWFVSEEVFDAALEKMGDRVWAGEEWEDAYDEFCAACPCEDGLELLWRDAVECASCGETVDREEALGVATEHGPGLVCPDCED